MENEGTLAMNTRVRTTCSGWEAYPRNLSSRDAVRIDWERLSKELGTRGKRIFSPSSDPIEVTLLDWYRCPERFLKRIFDSKKLLEEELRRHGDGPDTRVISICQEHPILPLEINEELMRKLLSYCRIGPEFLRVLFNFDRTPHLYDEGTGNVAVQKSVDGYWSISYLFKFVEQNPPPCVAPWSIRQIGVYHRICPRTKSSLWILLHPTTDQKALNVLKNSASRNKSQIVVGKPLYLHLLLLSTYFDNWRLYLLDLGQEYMKISDVAMTLDVSDMHEFGVSFRTVQRLRFLLDKVIPIPAQLLSSRVIITEIENLTKILVSESVITSHESSEVVECLADYHMQIEGYLVSVEVLQKRIEGVLGLLSDALSLKNQATATQISDRMLSLTRETVDDSATVKVVTFVSLVYLPAYFVASILSMGFFQMGSSGMSNTGATDFSISKSFWIYPVVTIPLTILTLGLWFWMTRRQRQQRGKKEEDGTVV